MDAIAVKSQETTGRPLFYEGQRVSIQVGGAVSLSLTAVYVEMIHGRVCAETPKAVHIMFDRGHCWFPKAALISQPSRFGDDGIFKLARWFHPSGEQARVIDQNVGR